MLRTAFRKTYGVKPLQSAMARPDGEVANDEAVRKGATGEAERARCRRFVRGLEGHATSALRDAFVFYLVDERVSSVDGSRGPFMQANLRRWQSCTDKI